MLVDRDFCPLAYIPCDKHGEENAASIARADNMPPNFKACRYCAQQFGSSSLSIHEQRCRQRPELAAEHELHDILVKHCPGMQRYCWPPTA